MYWLQEVISFRGFNTEILSKRLKHLGAMMMEKYSVEDAKEEESFEDVWDEENPCFNEKLLGSLGGGIIHVWIYFFGRLDADYHLNFSSFREKHYREVKLQDGLEMNLNLIITYPITHIQMAEYHCLKLSGRVICPKPNMPMVDYDHPCMLASLKYLELSNTNRFSFSRESWFRTLISRKKIHDKITSNLLDNSTGWTLKNKLKETIPSDDDAFNQHKRKETAKRVSSFAVSTVLFLGILCDIYSKSPMIQIQPLQQSASIWLSLLSLLGFMAFVWAVTTMILVGAPFNRMKGAMLVFWAILMHAESATSISGGVYLPILGIFFMGWLACALATI